MVVLNSLVVRTMRVANQMWPVCVSARACLFSLARSEKIVLQLLMVELMDNR